MALIVSGAIFKRFVVSKHHAMKVYRGSGGIAPHIINLGMRWR